MSIFTQLRQLKKLFEGKKKNLISLLNDAPLDENLKPIKIGDKNSILELSDTELKVGGDVNTTGDITGSDVTFGTGTFTSLTVDGSDVITEANDIDSIQDLSNVTLSGGVLEFAGVHTYTLGNTAGITKLDASGTIRLDSNQGDITFFNAGVVYGEMNMQTGTTLKLLSQTNFDLHLDAVGTGDLILESGGFVKLIAASYTYSEVPIGFTQDEPTFDDTDTIITFSTKGNKAKLTLTDNCADIHFKFPAVSGNFICVLLQDGTGGRTISNWKTKASDDTVGDGNSGLVLWAGGTAPTNTETADKADIASFYWDADNQIAYGTYTYNF